MDCSPPGSSVHGILQASILEWAAVSSSMGSSWPRNRTQGSLLQSNPLPSAPPRKPYIWEGVGLIPSFRTIITVWGTNGIPEKKILLLSVGASQIGLAPVCDKGDSVPSEPSHFPTCKVKWKLCLTLCYPMDCIAHQTPLFMEFSRQEYWSGLPCPFLGDLPDPGIKSLALQADSLLSEWPGKTRIMPEVSSRVHFSGAAPRINAQTLAF